MWIQYNDHFEPFYLIASKATFGSLPAEDQKNIADVAQEMTLASMDAMQERDRRYLEALRDAGIDVVILSDAELAACARIARAAVLPPHPEKLDRKSDCAGKCVTGR